MRPAAHVLLLAAAFSVNAEPPSDMPAATLSYTLRFPEPATHYTEVVAILPTAGAAEFELMMAVWTPGSYLVREYARNVEALTATSPSGEALRVSKVRKNRWRITTAGASAIHLSYRLYCREMSVRTNWVETSFALINGAATFLVPVDALSEAIALRVEPAPAWSQIITSLPPGSEPGTFLARNYDELADSPLYLGNPAVYEREINGVKHRLVNEGEGGVWNGAQSAEDAWKIAAAQGKLWGGFPYPHYTFLNLLTEVDGGLEHKNSTVLMAERARSRHPEDYRKWLSLVAHELFHAWNGKRLRPAELGPFDYENEVYTESLWIVEGLTSYYDDLLVHRAGLSTEKQYLAALSKVLEDLHTTPGRKVQPLRQASFDTWIKHYRPDENSDNASISYYTKGAIVGLLLDVEIRRASQGRRSLDDVMREAFRRFSGERGYHHQQFLALASEIAGADLSAFFRRALNTTEELDLTPALNLLGLKLENAKDEPKEGEAVAAWLGCETEVREGALVVTEVPRGTPAHAAGLAVDDEILALDGFRIPPRDFEARLESYRAGQGAELLVARRGKLTVLAVTVASEPDRPWKLVADPAASAAQQAARRAWLSGSP